MTLPLKWIVGISEKRELKGEKSIGEKTLFAFVQAGRNQCASWKSMEMDHLSCFEQNLCAFLYFFVQFQTLYFYFFRQFIGQTIRENFVKVFFRQKAWKV